MALGKTDRIPIILSVWTPIITLSLFSFIGYCKLMKINFIFFIISIFFIHFHSEDLKIEAKDITLNKDNTNNILKNNVHVKTNDKKISVNLLNMTKT